jgi:DNA-binding LacI/PurR family transcriptional regulator
MSSRCGEIAGRYLLHKGHREIAYFSEPGIQRIRGTGIEQVFTDAGYPDGVHFHEIPTRYNEVVEPRVEIRFRLENCRTYLTSSQDFHLSPKMRELIEQLRLEVRNETAHPGFDRVFEKALENEKVSAWVCYNDYTALRARTFLRNAGIDVPGRISLMGFDDSLEARLSQLTSYNFNGAAICHHMVSLILENHLTRMKRIPEFDGFVTERTTTRL